jgi:hypothetical protein
MFAADRTRRQAWRLVRSSSYWCSTVAGRAGRDGRMMADFPPAVANPERVSRLNIFPWTMCVRFMDCSEAPARAGPGVEWCDRLDRAPLGIEPEFRQDLLRAHSHHWRPRAHGCGQSEPAPAVAPVESTTHPAPSMACSRRLSRPQARIYARQWAGFLCDSEMFHLISSPNRSGRGQHCEHDPGRLGRPPITGSCEAPAFTA